MSMQCILQLKYLQVSTWCTLERKFPSGMPLINGVKERLLPGNNGFWLSDVWIELNKFGVDDTETTGVDKIFISGRDLNMLLSAPSTNFWLSAREAIESPSAFEDLALSHATTSLNFSWNGRHLNKLKTAVIHKPDSQELKMNVWISWKFRI